ncbi:MAG: hypothetical protein V4580_04045 [Bacteroidota bacterium]
MIDKDTGHIIISNAIHIKHNDLKQYMSLLNIGETSSQRDHPNGWSWIQENNVFKDNLYFIIQFGFFENKLKEIVLSVSHTKFDTTQTWDSWSETKELEKLETYKTWLHSELGSQTEFTWGTASAFYDAKGGSSVVHLRYR